MWFFKDKIIKDVKDFGDKKPYGFIYEVTHIPSGKKYLGKKVLYFEQNKRLGKKALEALREEKKAKGIRGKTPLKQKIVTESDWKTYYGSHKDILKLVKEGKKQDFKREILMCVESKKLLTYYECKLLFEKDVLESDDYINSNILGKFYKTDFH